MKLDEYDLIKEMTKETIRSWKDTHGISPNAVSNKLDNAMLDWISELTDTLDIWLSKCPNLTDGELILARVNLGSLVESWLKFFYCIYLDDYRSKPIKKRQAPIDPDHRAVSFEDLKQYSRNILWSKGDNIDSWVEKIQQYRNAVHSFLFREIGTPQEFVSDIKVYCEFIDTIRERLPPIDDYREDHSDW